MWWGGNKCDGMIAHLVCCPTLMLVAQVKIPVAVWVLFSIFTPYGHLFLLVLFFLIHFYYYCIDLTLQYYCFCLDYFQVHVIVFQVPFKILFFLFSFWYKRGLKRVSFLVCTYPKQVLYLSFGHILRYIL